MHLLMWREMMMMKFNKRLYTPSIEVVDIHEWFPDLHMITQGDQGTVADKFWHLVPGNCVQVQPDMPKNIISKYINVYIQWEISW